MAADIKAAFADAVVSLVEGSGGVFEVSVDDDLVFSKLKLGRHAQPEEVVNLLRQGMR